MRKTGFSIYGSLSSGKYGAKDNPRLSRATKPKTVIAKREGRPDLRMRQANIAVIMQIIN